MNRVSTAQFNRSSISTMNQKFANIANLQQQISTGKRNTSITDDPYASSAANMTREQSRVNAQFQRNIDTVTSRTALQEGTLGSVMDAVQRVRELAVQGGNSTLKDVDREVIGTELYQLAETLKGFANAQDASGNYLFAGYDIDQPPVAHKELGGNDFVTISDDDREPRAEIAEDVYISTGLPAAKIFARMPSENAWNAASSASDRLQTNAPIVIDPDAIDASANYEIAVSMPASTYTVTNTVSGSVVGSGAYAQGDPIEFDGLRVALAGTPNDGDSVSVAPSKVNDMFSSIYTFARTIADETLTSSARAQISGNLIAAADDAVIGISTAQAELGARLNRLDRTKDESLDYDLVLSERLSDFEDTDMAEAISLLDQEMTVLQAVQQSYSRVSQLSLFNYL